MNKIKITIVLGMIIVISFILRITCAIYYPQYAPDSADYKTLALRLVGDNTLYREGSQVDIRRPPLYPLFLSFIYRTLNTENQTVFLVQALLSSFLPLFTYGIARVLKTNTSISLLAALLTAIHPELVVPNSYILTEILSTCLLTCTVLLILKACQKNEGNLFLLAGLGMALTTLCRPATLFYPFFLCGVMLIFTNGRKMMRPFSVFMIMFLIVLAPWILRNYQRHHAFIPVSIGAGIALWSGSYEKWDGDYNYKDLSDMEPIIAGKDAIEADDALKHDALKNIAQNPWSYIKLCVKKIYRFWCWVPGNKRTLEHKPSLKMILYMIHIPLLILAIMGAYQLRRGGFLYLVFLTPILYFTILHAILFAIPRYRIPIMPLFLILASSGLYALRSCLFPNRDRVSSQVPKA